MYLYVFLVLPLTIDGIFFKRSTGEEPSVATDINIWTENSKENSLVRPVRTHTRKSVNTRAIFFKRSSGEQYEITRPSLPIQPQPERRGIFFRTEFSNSITERNDPERVEPTTASNETERSGIFFKSHTSSKPKNRVERAYFAKVNSTPFPEGKVYYLFEEGVRQKTERMVINAMRKISQNVPCIKFLKVTPANTNHIPHRLIISDKLPGCKVTKVGYRGEWHTSSLLNVEFDKCLTEGVIEHELMHILGAVHTHTRPDRNNFVELDTTNIKTGYQRQFAMVRSSLDKTDYKYDYNSAMHYGPGYFANDKSKSVLSVKPPNIGEFSSSQTISERDIRSLRDWYGCGKRCPFDQETCEQSDRLKSWHNSTDISDFDSRDKLEESDTIITKLTSIVNGDTAADTVQRLTRRSISDEDTEPENSNQTEVEASQNGTLSWSQDKMGEVECEIIPSAMRVNNTNRIAPVFLEAAALVVST